MKNLSLKDKREMMFKFMLDNIQVKKQNSKNLIERLDDKIIFTGKDNKEYLVFCFSKQKDFDIDFKKVSERFDEDKRKLDSLNTELINLVSYANHKGCIPGFVLLRSVPDYSKLKIEGKKRVNQGHFLKQLVQTTKLGIPFYDMVKLDPMGRAIFDLYNSFYNGNGKFLKKREGRYLPGVYSFNSKKNNLENIWLNSPNKDSNIKWDFCPTCKEDNDVSHKYCKGKTNREYTKSVIQRDISRYVFYFTINKLLDGPLTFYSKSNNNLSLAHIK